MNALTSLNRSAVSHALASRGASSIVAGMVIAALVSAATGQVAPPRYTVIDLAALSTTSTGISNGGHVCGTYFPPGELRRGFVWEQGEFTDIGTLGGVTVASAVNDTGVTVGYSVDVNGRQHAVRLQDGALGALGMLHGGTHANANDINNDGWIVGMSQRRFGNEMYDRAALWRNGTVLDLGTFGGEYSEARGVNNAGQVVGWAWYPLPTRDQHAFIWTDADGLFDLGTLGGRSSSAADVNDHGAVVGTSQLQPGSSASHGFLWTPQDGMIDLGSPAGTDDSSAVAINNAGQIIGNTWLFRDGNLVAEPLLWENAELHLINELLEPGSEWTVVGVSDISDRGEIAGIARQGQQPYRAVVLRPLPRIVEAAPVDGVEVAPEAVEKRR